MENNKDTKTKIDVEETPLDREGLYDDLPPASQARMNTVGASLSALLLREVSMTLQDVNRALAVLNEIERYTAPRRAVGGEMLPSAFQEAFQQLVRRYGLDEAVREQLKHLQSAAFKANLETTLRQVWQSLREQSGRLRETLSQAAPGPVRPEQYVATDEAPVDARPAPPAPATTGPAYVAPAPEPVRELVVDIFNEPDSDEVVLIAEHPGLDENSIETRLYHDIVTLHALGLDGQRYSHETLLPFQVEPASRRQQYRNGVLEIRFRRI